MNDTIHDMFTNAGVQRPEDTIGYLMWRVAHRHQREIDRALADIDLTHLQFVALVQTAWMLRTQAQVTQPELATFSNIHPMQLSNVLKALAEKLLLTRPRSRADSRIKLVVPTPAGIDLLGVALPRVQAVQRSFFGPPDNADAIKAALRQIVASWGDAP